ncbi:putative ribosomal protein L10 [Candidatus Carsonella ruddii HT isolate Thao2000]|uniref:Putative ribosomal protein L10 n=1 Tax=Candidatus Carsonella ruddii HT isolate Thao2000 TaxID=1202539 RepID=J3VQH2_CARRU|nr:hypothetical protein [Candidatus Carsonella ruddii]AFP84211.1 putative ribosomal protein L10 [Candidatus Carsonella ruddii HT isolate Thao2000]
MNNFYIKYNNLNILLKNNYLFLCYDMVNINFSLLNLIKKKTNNRIIYLNKKIFKYLNIKYSNNLYIILIDNECNKIQNTIIFIFNLLKKKPSYIINKNIIINKIPILEISKLSKKNLILEIVNYFKTKLLKLINLLKTYGKIISK